MNDEEWRSPLGWVATPGIHRFFLPTAAAFSRTMACLYDS
jgi:hypothetical protein